MPKVGVKRYGRRKFYHEIFHQIYDIIVCNDNAWPENSYTPINHVWRHIGIKKNNMAYVTRETVKKIHLNKVW